MSEKKDNSGYVALVFIGILIAAGIYIFLNDPVTAVEDNYQYSNGKTVFNVTKVSDIETYITLYITKNEYPYVLGLRNDPLSLEDIPVYGTVNTRIYGDSEVYITIHPEATEHLDRSLQLIRDNGCNTNYGLFHGQPSP